MLEHAHFLRPWWLLLLLAPIILYFLPRAKAHSTPWQRIVDPHLLPYIISAQPKIKSFGLKRLFVPIFLALLALALAGPTIKKIPDSSSLIKKPAVILLELSPDMLAHDISPSRLKRALYKIKDFLEAQKAREVALIAYAGDAHVVVPLTEDYKTILSLSESLSPALMPTSGSNLLDALKLARSMGDNNIIIMSSSNINDTEQVKSYIKQNPMRLNFWWFASEKGAPIVADDGSFKKSHDGSVSMSSLRSDIISQLAALPHAYSQLFTPDTQDITALSKNLDHEIGPVEGVTKSFYDTWFDLGPYVLILAMALFLWAAATQGASWYLLCFLFIFPGPKAHANFFTELFSRSDQQAFDALSKNNPQKAAELYPDNFGKGTAYFKAKNFEKAAEHLEKVSTSDGRYNLGNAYAQLGKIQEAIEAYKQALKLDPNNKDAQHNKEVLEKLAQDQQKDQKQKDQKQEEQKQEEQKQEEQKQEEKKQKDQKQEEQKQEEQKQQEQKQEQQKQGQEDQKPSKQEKAPEPVQKPEDQKLKEGSAMPESKPNEDKSMRYYLDHLEQNNNLYLKRKFLHESRQRNGEQQ